MCRNDNPRIRRTRAGAIGLVATLTVAASPACADEFSLKSRVGQCEYTYAPQRDERRTKCAAEALFVNLTTSEAFLCRAEVEGDQYVAPSVPETAPDVVACTRLGQPLMRGGPYDVASTDDTAKNERTFNRMQGNYSWKNAFWVSSRSAQELKFCAHTLTGAGADSRLRCSKTIEWRK